MVEKTHSQLSIRRQCELLAVNRNRLEPKRPKITEEDEQIMRLMDEIHLNDPAFGARRMRDLLKRDHGLHPGRNRIVRLMRLAEVYACYPRPRTSIPGPGHEKHPYLLRNLEITHPNQVWCADITYIPMPVGFCYLVAVMDWYSRAVLGWAVSTTMDTNFCLEAWRMAVRTAGCTPGIMNTDQGSQFTSNDWLEEIKDHESVQISMDGKGRWVDNVFIERLWWSLKYEDVYLKAYETPLEVERGAMKWFKRYNDYRPHSALNGQTPWQVHEGFKDEEAA
jgi:putative transposase